MGKLTDNTKQKLFRMYVLSLGTASIRNRLQTGIVARTALLIVIPPLNSK